MMLHPGNLALLGNSCIFIRQSRSDQGPTANRNMSSLLVTKATRAFPLPPGCREIEVLPCGPFPGSRRLSRRMGHGTQALRFYITRSIETFWDFHGCGPVVKTQCSQCRGHKFNLWLGNPMPHSTVKKRKKGMPSFCSYEVDLPTTVS